MNVTAKSLIYSHLIRTTAAVATLALAGCGDARAKTEPPTAAEVAAEESRADKQGLESLAKLQWSSLSAAATSDDPSSFNEERLSYLSTGAEGFEYLLKLLKDPELPSNEAVLALLVVEQMGPSIKSPELRIEAVSQILSMRDAASTDELRDACSTSLMTMLNLAIEASPEDSNLYFFRGDEQLSRKEYEKAISDLTRALEIRPQFSNANYLRGIAYRGIGDNERAIEEYSAALTIEPAYPDVLIMRADAYLEASQPEKAVSDITAAIQLDGKMPHAYEVRARAYHALGREEESKSDLERAKGMRASSTSSATHPATTP